MGLGETGAIAVAVALTSAGLTYLIMMRSRSESKPSGSCTIDNDNDDWADLWTAGLHRWNPELQMAGRAKAPRPATAYFRNQPNATHVIRIALTGGPCAGKSSALAVLRKRATAEGFDVYTAPEVATLLLNSGCGFPADRSGTSQFVFQKAICDLQLALERNLTRIVQGTGRPSIIIFDRGLMDAKAYVDAEMWRQVLSELTTSGATDTESQLKPSVVTVGVTEEYCLKRYDGVVHLVTAAEGAEQFYKTGQVTDDSGNAVVRRETKDEALQQDYKLRQVWKDHPHHYIVGNEGTFQDKLNTTVRVVLQLAEDTHPAESLRAKTSSGPAKDP